MKKINDKNRKKHAKAAQKIKAMFIVFLNICDVLYYKQIVCKKSQKRHEYYR